MKIALALIGSLVVAGCSEAPKQAEAPLPPPASRWSVVPAGTEAYQGKVEYAAWRLDSQTGELAFCRYDPGPDKPVVVGGKVVSSGPTLDCSQSDTPR